MKITRTRFAPSPTGFMHIGNLRTALYEYLIAKSQNGNFILRIEDTDQDRFVDGATEIIYRSLKLVGLNHDEGPDIGGEFGPYIQSERKEIYLKYAKQLIDEDKAYYCFCTKERLESLKKDNEFAGYDRFCRNLSKETIENNLANGKPYVIRQKVPLDGSTTFTDTVFGDITIENKEIEDQILIKSDGLPTYNFANVIDDHLMKITHVVRGSEYLTSTPKYNMLYDSFGWEKPIYVHLPLIMGKNDDGSISKLSKRHGSTSLEDLINEGYLTDAIINYIALLGWSPSDNTEIFSLDELVKSFSINRISKSPAIFDYEKLSWFNGEYIRKMTDEQFEEKAIEYYSQVFGEKSVPYNVLDSILKPRINKFNEIPSLLSFLSTMQEYSPELYTNKKSKTDLNNSPEMIRAAIEVLSNIDDTDNWTVDKLHDSMIQLAEKLGVKNGTLLWPVRIALAGQTVTPGGAMEIMAILGKNETITRLEHGLEIIKRG